MKNKKGGGAQLWGVVLYDILGDGCLNGVWTNNHTEGKKTMNEIARKKRSPEKDPIAGEYYVSWIEEKGGPVTGTLRIESRITHYSLEWVVSGKSSFKGVGILVGEDRLAVTYWEGEGISFPVGE
ncbi:MAG TPA: hypothetical protein VIM64_17955 [Puia sp.]